MSYHALMSFAILLTLGCRDRLPDRYEGVPDNATCTWDIVHMDRGQCISAGRRFRCIRRDRYDSAAVWTQVSCVPTRTWM